MLPVVRPDGEEMARQILISSLLLIPVSLVPGFLATSGWLYLAGALTLGLMYFGAAARAARDRTADSRPAVAAGVRRLFALALHVHVDRRKTHDETGIHEICRQAAARVPGGRGGVAGGGHRPGLLAVQSQAGRRRVLSGAAGALQPQAACGRSGHGLPLLPHRGGDGRHGRGASHRDLHELPHPGAEPKPAAGPGSRKLRYGQADSRGCASTGCPTSSSSTTARTSAPASVASAATGAWTR